MRYLKIIQQLKLINNFNVGCSRQRVAFTRTLQLTGVLFGDDNRNLDELVQKNVNLLNQMSIDRTLVIVSLILVWHWNMLIELL